MAVTIPTSVADPAGASASSNIATYSNISIGTAAEDRIVALVVTSELTSASPNSATINYGNGAIAMSASTQGNFGVVYARIFWAPAPTGTTATFAVTFGANPNNTQNHVSVYKITGARPLPTTGGNGSTDMDATAPLTTGAITIATNGGFLAVAAGATDTVAKTWANATEDLDVDAGALRHTTAIRTTALTATAVTCTGGTNAEDGAMSWSIWTPGTFITALTPGAYTLTGTAASLERGYVTVAAASSYALTGSAATVSKGLTLSAAAGSYTLTGTAASLERGFDTIAGAGSYTVTGTDASLELGREVVAGAGSYAVTGTDAGLELGREIVPDSGVYALTGTDASLEQGREVNADAGSYALTGTDATLTYTPFSGGYTVSASPGSYTLTGTSATLAVAGATCTPAFQPTAFQTDAFQTCVTGDTCTPAFQPTAFQSNAFQVCPDQDTEPTPATGGGYYPYSYSRGTGRLKFDIPTLPVKKTKRKGKRKQKPQDEARDYLEYIAEGLDLPPDPPYVADLLQAFRLIIEQRQLADEERQRRLILAFLEMEEDEREAELLLLAS